MDTGDPAQVNVDDGKFYVEGIYIYNIFKSSYGINVNIMM